MNESSGTRRRDILRIGALGVSGATAAALAGRGETQIVEREVVKVVTQEVPVEKVVTQIVEKAKVIEKEVPVEVQKVVTRNNLFDWEDPNMYHQGSLEGEKFEFPPNANEISSLIAAALDEVVLGKKSAEVALSEL